jgi:hypothetical protein
LSVARGFRSVWLSVAIVLALEAVALLVIRDNLTQHPVLYPVDAIRLWQANSAGARRRRPPPPASASSRRQRQAAAQGNFR